MTRFPAQFGREGVDDLSRDEKEEINKAHGTNLCSDGDRQEMNKANVLVPDDLDLVDEPESTGIVPELLFGDGLVETAEVDVPTCVALADSRGWGWVFPSQS